VALLKVLREKVLSYNDAFPFIAEGFSISEIIVRISAPLNALLPMLVTLLGMVIEVRPEQLSNA